MHALVCVKRVVDPNVKVRIRQDGSDVELSGVKMAVNPFDEVAVEQAVRLKEKGVVTRVTAVTVGGPAAQDVLRSALAMGADAAIHVVTASVPEPLAVARMLRAVVDRESPQLVLCGKQAIDEDLGATGPMLAALLDWPQAVSVHDLAIEGAFATASCDTDSGVERLVLNLPAVICVDLRLCEPRNISLPAMMRARKATLAVLPTAELGVEASNRLVRVGVSEPEARAGGVRVDTIEELVHRLRVHPALACPELAA